MSASGATRGLAVTTGANIRTGRKAKGLTQAQVTRALDLKDGMAVSRWERGLNPPSTENALKLAELLFDGDLGALYAPIAEAA